MRERSGQLLVLLKMSHEEAKVFLYYLSSSAHFCLLPGGDSDTALPVANL